ncbi:peptide ABC transporter substrate-binding protein [Amaricoccus macauensis]|uniref:peptide ABC transporter substrate-binding protein n=1 Tax=Amaricoccus macauensis TaxID=57001 RepID=UPI003C7C6873
MKLRPILAAGVAMATLGATSAFAERGTDGQVNILYWQAISTMNPFLSNGTKDLEASSLVLEPMARFNERGEMVPWLAQDIPTLDNGGFSEDFTTITWKLKEGLLWSDGSPVTAADAVFTWEYCMHPEGGCAQATNFSGVENVEALDDLTVQVTFSEPKPYPYGPFVGHFSPIIQQSQFADCMGARAPECTEANFYPIGTGPFVVKDFKANDLVYLEANPNFRDPEKPAFASALIKGGGDAASAARSVLETGEFDYAWNPQVEPEILAQMEAAGNGEIIAAFGSLVERLMINQSNPDPALGDERSTLAHPHPFLTDKAVTKALSLAIDREILVEAGYGAAGKITCNIIPMPEINVSTNNDWCMTQDMDEANRLLDEAGYTRGGDGIREKDGVRLSVLYQTSTNSVRQAAQALIKQWWNELGVEVELRQIDGAVFFGGDPGSPDTFQKFYADVQEYANNYNGTDPEEYLGDWTCAEVPRPETQWQGSGDARHCDPEYDALWAELGKTAGEEERAEIIIKLNDMIVNSGSYIPLVYRGRVAAKSNTLGGVVMNPVDSEIWNTADWYRVE